MYFLNENKWLMTYREICLFQKFSNCGAPPHRGAPLVLWGRSKLIVWETFILNEIWTQDKNINLYRHFALLKYFTSLLVPVLAPNYKQHILSPVKVRKAYCSLAELYDKRVYLNLFGWRGARHTWNVLKRGATYKVWAPLVYSKNHSKLINTLVGKCRIV
jgi:hypothetical protein